MSDWSYVWGGILLLIGLIEARTILNDTPGDTISEQTRLWWRTSTKTGKAAFLLAWFGFCAWFAWHIVS